MENSFEKFNRGDSVMRKAEIADIPIIKDLIDRNLYKNLSKEEAERGGFFYEPTEEDLKKCIEDTGVCLNFKGEEFRGFFSTMSVNLALEIPMMSEMVKNISDMVFDGKKIEEYKYGVLAQLCISENFRGTPMVFLRLHQATHSMLKDAGCELAIGEVWEGNTASMRAHQFLQDIGSYVSSSGKRWHIFVADLRQA